MSVAIPSLGILIWGINEPTEIMKIWSTLFPSVCFLMLSVLLCLFSLSSLYVPVQHTHLVTRKNFNQKKKTLALPLLFSFVFFSKHNHVCHNCIVMFIVILIPNKLACCVKWKWKLNAILCEQTVFTNNSFAKSSQAHVLISFIKSCLYMWMAEPVEDAPFITKHNTKTCYLLQFKHSTVFSVLCCCCPKLKHGARIQFNWA